METEELFKELLGRDYVNPTGLMNGTTEWTYICHRNDYALLRRTEYRDAFVIAWKPEFTSSNVSWAQGHYMDGTFDDALKVFRQYAHC